MYKVSMLAGITLLVFACGNEEHHHAHDAEAPSEMQNQQPGNGAANIGDSETVVSPEAMAVFDEVLESYLRVSEALTASDPETAAEHSEQMNGHVRNFMQQEFEPAIRAELGLWGVDLLEASDHIGSGSDVEEQRKAFLDLSDTMIAMVDAIGHSRNALYHQRCPMVNGGNGDWLSTEERIWNPYHGDRMMHCGSTIRSL
ncbi:DUF3347 domain-containing protein [Balneolales bacterium ANBcel1]|nr:DUF3347 domain-containing protein [Balneolales bacterium ANBcel1]